MACHASNKTLENRKRAYVIRENLEVIADDLHLRPGYPLQTLVPRRAKVRSTQLRAPRAVVLVDTREQTPFEFSRFSGWFVGVERKALRVGDYTIAGLEDICAVERKDLAYHRAVCAGYREYARVVQGRGEQVATVGATRGEEDVFADVLLAAEPTIAGAGRAARRVRQ